MKLRVHYEYKLKVRTKNFSGDSIDIDKLAEEVAKQRKFDQDGYVTFTDDTCKGFALPARNIVLMEVIG